MTTRTSSTRVVFFQPFKLSGMDSRHPAGSYTIETDEDLLEGLSFPAYLRTGTYIVLPSPPGSPISRQTLKIIPEDLEAALRLDLESSLSASRASDSPVELTLNDLLTTGTVRAAISSTSLSLGEFKDSMRDLIHRRAARNPAADVL